MAFGASTFRFAAPNDSPISKLEDIEGKRVATSFDKLVHDYLAEHGINAEPYTLMVPSNRQCNSVWLI